MSNSTVPVGATGLSDPGEEIVNPAVAVRVCPVTTVGFTTAVTPVLVAARFTVWVIAGEVDPVKLPSPEYTVRISSPEKNAANACAQEEVPRWVIEFQARASVAHPVTPPQMVPPSVEYWKATDPVGPAGLSEPGEEMDTVALSATVCPDTETSGVAITDVDVAAWLTVSVALGEVEEPKFGSPE
jgi:hypothetical protein